MPVVENSLVAPCPACGGSAGKDAPVLVEDHEYRVPFQARYASCSGCRTAFQVPMPSFGELASFYPQDYHSRTSRNFAGRLKDRVRLHRLLRWIDNDSTVLDYGCGDGAFLMAASKALPGATLFGYEIAPSFSRTTLNNGAVVLIEGSFDDLLREIPSCRLITMNHVIEHLPDPAQTLSALHQKLLPGGILEGQTPAAACFEQKVFKSSWSGYHAPRHTVIFSPEGLATFLGRIGFEAIKTESAFNPAGLAVSLASWFHQEGSTARVRREGLSWLFWLATAAALAPMDLLSGAPGIMNFYAKKHHP